MADIGAHVPAEAVVMHYPREADSYLRIDEAVEDIKQQMLEKARTHHPEGSLGLVDAEDRIRRTMESVRRSLQSQQQQLIR